MADSDQAATSCAICRKSAEHRLQMLRPTAQYDPRHAWLCDEDKLLVDRGIIKLGWCSPGRHAGKAYTRCAQDGSFFRTAEDEARNITSM
jgi:hypothetical protein